MTGPNSPGRPPDGAPDIHAKDREKLCENCGVLFRKGRNETWRRWYARRFCSVDCIVRGTQVEVTTGPNQGLEVPPGGWAMAWVRTKGGHLERVKAKVVGPLAVHRRLDIPGSWTITHLPTCACFGRFGSYPAAQRAAVDLREADGCHDDGPRLYQAETLEDALDILRGLRARSVVAGHGGSVPEDV